MVSNVVDGGTSDRRQKWLGPATTETAANYADAVGEEQQNIAARRWTRVDHRRSSTASLKIPLRCRCAARLSTGSATIAGSLVRGGEQRT